MHKTRQESKGSDERTLKKVLFQGAKDKSAPTRHLALLKLYHIMVESGIEE